MMSGISALLLLTQAQGTDPNFAQHGRGDSSNFSFNRILQITVCVVFLRKPFILEESPNKKIAGVQI